VDNLHTQVVISELQVECKTEKVCHTKTDILPLYHADIPSYLHSWQIISTTGIVSTVQQTKEIQMMVVECGNRRMLTTITATNINVLSMRMHQNTLNGHSTTLHYPYTELSIKFEFYYRFNKAKTLSGICFLSDIT